MKNLKNLNEIILLIKKGKYKKKMGNMLQMNRKEKVMICCKLWM